MNPQATSQQQQQQQLRPLSARGAALPLADRVALYCRQTSAANNAGMMRNVAKPSAPEMLEFLTQETKSQTLYGNPSLVRVLLTDSDYDSVCREVLSLSDAVEWYSQHVDIDDQPQSPSASTSLEMMFQSAHVFSSDEVVAAKQLALERGLEDVVRRFTDHGERVGGDNEGDDLVDPVAGGDIGASGKEVRSEPVDQTSGILVTETDTESSPEGAIEEAIEFSVTAAEGPERGVGAPLEEDQRRSVDEPVEEIEDRFDPEHNDEKQDSTRELSRDDEEQQDYVQDAAAPEAAGDLAAETESPLEKTSSDLSEPNEYPDSTDLVPLTEQRYVDEQVQSSGANHDGESHSSHATEVQSGTESETQETPTSIEPTTPTSREDLASQSRISPDELPPDTASSDLRAVDERPSPSLTHSASTVERIVRTLDKQIQGPESDEQDATIELAITHDATLLERRYSAIAEEVDKAADLAISSLHNQVDKATPDASAASSVTGDRLPDRATPVVSEDATPVSFEETADGKSTVPTEIPVAPRLEATALGAAIPFEASRVMPLPVFRVGEPVEARYRGWNRYFQGEIAAVVDGVAGVYEVRYADGDYEVNVPADFIRPLEGETLELIPTPQVVLESADSGASRYAIGDQVEALYRGRTRWYPGRVAHVQSATSTHSATYDIAYDDGETEKGVMDHHVRARPISAANSSASSVGAALIESAATLIQNTAMEVDDTIATIATEEEEQQTEEPGRRWRIGDRVRVQQIPSPLVLVAWIVGVSKGRDDVYDVLYDAGGGGQRAGEKESGVAGSRIQRHDIRPPIDEPQDEIPAHQHHFLTEHVGSEGDKARGNQANESDQPEVTPVLPFHGKPESDQDVNHKSKQTPAVPPVVLEATRLLAQVSNDEEEENESQTNVLSEPSEAEDSDSDADSILQSTAHFKPTTPRSNQPVLLSVDKRVRDVAKPTSASVKKPTAKRKKQQPTHEQHPEPLLSEATLRYLTPQARKPIERPRTGRSQGATTPRSGTATATKAPKSKPAAPTVDVSWKELEEWKNVDLILNRKRKIVNNGQVEGSEVPWGEEFAAIQSLKRFAHQYPDVLKQHIEHQLQEVVNSSTATSAARPMTTSATAAARDALLLVKDLAFLLRHRLAPFLDTILPVVLPAVFHSQKRFLCDTAYQVLEALVAHCSSRKLVVALLKQAQRFPRDDTRLVNLTCLYVEKCLACLSFAAVQELITRSTIVVLEALADLLGCKSAACQSSLQKSLLLIQQAIGDETMESLLEDHLMGNALAIVRKHLSLAVTAACHGPNKSPQASPKKLQATPAKQAAVTAANAASAGGSMSILQRMLLQRQNRVVPAPE